MFENYTDRARKIFVLAEQEAVLLKHNYVGAEHILLGLIKEGSGVGAYALKKTGINLEKARQSLLTLVSKGTCDIPLEKLNKLPRNKDSNLIISFASQVANDLHHEYVGTEHILLGLLKTSNNHAITVLENLGVKFDVIRKEVLDLLDVNSGCTAPEAPGSSYLRKIEIFIWKAHSGQTRSNGNEYANHPISVMHRLQNAGITDEKILATALCHDLLEDTKVTEEQIAEIAGPEVLEAVKQLTNKVDVSGIIDANQRFNMKHTNMLQHARSYGDIAKRVKLADRYDNLSDAIWDWQPERVKRYARAGLELLNIMTPLPEDVRKFEQEARRFFSCLI